MKLLLQNLWVWTYVAVLTFPSTSFAETSVNGSLKGSDGTPMRLAHVHIMPFDGGEMKSYQVQPDGTFSLNVPDGMVNLSFSGVGHSQAEMRGVFLGGQNATFEVTLKANSPLRLQKSFSVIGDFNNFDFSKQIPLKKSKNGTWKSVVSWDKPTLAYQIVMDGSEDIETRSVNGTDLDSVVYDGGGDYRSVVKVVKGKAVIVFDPNLLPEQSGEEVARAADGTTLAAREIMSEIQRTGTLFFQWRKNKDTDFNPARLKNGIWTVIQEEKDQVVKQLRYLHFLSVRGDTITSALADKSRYAGAVMGIPCSSAVWQYQPSLFLSGLHRGELNQREMVNKFLTDQPSAGTRSQLIYSILQDASYKKDTATVREYYTRMQNEFADTWSAKSAKKEFDPAKKVKVGNMVPEFTFDNVDVSGRKVSNSVLKGNWTLIDNWATWCGPCVAEMAQLHSAFEKFKSKKFQILSVSFDQSIKDIEKFRAGKWKMPWIHAFSEGVWENKASEVFEVVGIPKPILVDPNGIIVALDGLRGDELTKTLEILIR